MQNKSDAAPDAAAHTGGAVASPPERCVTASRAIDQRFPFLKKINGGLPQPAGVKYYRADEAAWRQNWVVSLCGIGNEWCELSNYNVIAKRYAQLGAVLPDDCFVIGADAEDIPNIVLSWRGCREIQVWIKVWTDEMDMEPSGDPECAMYKVAESFGDFISNLSAIEMGHDLTCPTFR